MTEIEPVSAAIRQVGAQVRAEHHTIGVLRTLPGDVNQLDCACGVVLTNGPGWSLDEHLRMHRAEVKYAALLAVAHPDMPLSRRTTPGPAAAALDALLAGDDGAAAELVAAMDEDGRTRLAAAAAALADLATDQGSRRERTDASPSDDALVEWAPGFPTLGRFGRPDTEDKVREMVVAWNQKVAEGRESFPAGVYRRVNGGEWAAVE